MGGEYWKKYHKNPLFSQINGRFAELGTSYYTTKRRRLHEMSNNTKRNKAGRFTKSAVIVTIECDHCGEDFDKKQSRMKYSKRHFCSNECSDLHKKVAMKGENNPSYGKEWTDERKQKRSERMKEQWEDEEYRRKILEGLHKARKAQEERGISLGWDDASREKRKATMVKRYGHEHNWASSDLRQKATRKWVEQTLGISYEEYEAKLETKDNYYRAVRRLTENQPLHLLENHEKRAHRKNTKDAYHLDHIIPISYGWVQGIPPETIADISNLRFVTWFENQTKTNKYEPES